MFSSCAVQAATFMACTTLRPPLPPLPIGKDFLIFCKLAVKSNVIPPGWRWDTFLETATGLLPYAFEKSDAKEKWGGENVFTAMMGGRSLRFTGEVVYGFSCMGPGGSSTEHTQVKRSVRGKWKALVDGEGAADLFADVGGAEAWKKLHSKLHIPHMGY